MGEQIAFVPGPDGEFVELAATAAPPKAQGRVFRKQILKYGDLKYKNGKTYKVDEQFVDTLVSNFATSGNIVHAPKAGPRNEHTDDPDRNIGEVIDVVKTDKGAYIDIDVRTDDADKLGKTLLGVSGLIDLNHTQRDTGQAIGPTLLHACITNRPYVTNLEPFQEVLTLSDDVDADIFSDVIVLTESQEEAMPTREEAIEALKKDHGIDVVALSAEVEELRPLRAEVETLRPQAANFVALSNKVSETFKDEDGVLALSAGESGTVEQFIETIDNAGTRIVALSAEVQTAKDEQLQLAAETEVDKLVLSGFILPKNRDIMVKLRKSDEESFRGLLPDQAVLNLSQEQGAAPGDEDHSGSVTVESEIDRLVKLSSETSAAV